MIKTQTSHLIVVPSSGPQALEVSFKIVLLFFHIQNNLVAFSEETGKAPDLNQEAATNFESKF